MGKMKLFLTAFCILFFAGFAYGQPPEPLSEPEIYVPASLAVLIEESKAMDGKGYIIEGEFVGEQLFAGGGRWLNILEDGNPCAVFVGPAVKSVDGLSGGNHQMLGHRLRIHGVLNRICLEHGGDNDFHATKIEILAAPQPRSISTMWWEKWLLAALLILALILWYHLPISFSQNSMTCRE